MIPEVRCQNCHKKLAENLKGQIEIVCPRCGHYNHVIDQKSASNLTKSKMCDTTISNVH